MKVCPVFYKGCLGTFGEHTIYCKELPDFKHNFNRDVLFVIFRRAGVYVKKEMLGNFLFDQIDERSTLRSPYVIVYGCLVGKHVCVNLIEISPLVELGSGNFTVGQASLKVASNKVAKHEKICFDNQHVFIPFAFDTLAS
jgi:hypothetical protein